MSYTPTEWETGDVITAVKLNNMETGITNALAPVITNPQDGQTLVYDATAGVWKNGNGNAANVFYATYTPTSGTTATCDKTYSEIAAAIDAGALVIAKVVAGANAYQLIPMTAIANSDNVESVVFANVDVTAEYVIKVSIEHFEDDEITLSTITFVGPVG